MDTLLKYEDNIFINLFSMKKKKKNYNTKNY